MYEELLSVGPCEKGLIISIILCQERIQRLWLGEARKTEGPKAGAANAHLTKYGVMAAL